MDVELSTADHTVQIILLSPREITELKSRTELRLSETWVPLTCHRALVFYTYIFIIIPRHPTHLMLSVIALSL